MPHSARRCPAVRQPVSSMFTAPAPRSALQQVRVGLGERVAGAREDRVDRAGADPRAEQLLAELHDITARDTVAHRERRDGRLKTRAERALGDLRRQLAARALTAAGAAHPLAAMLGHLTVITGSSSTCWRTGSPTASRSLRAKTWPQSTALGPMLDDLIHRPRRQQRAALALMPGLGALFATRWILATPRRAGRRIGARRQRRVTRAAVQPTLELGDPLILPRDPRSQRLDLSDPSAASTSTTASRPAS